MSLFSDKPSLKEYKNTTVDWRLPENRVEAFCRVFDTRMQSGELDHWLAGKIIVDYMKLTDEQKAWYCILFGFSYRNHVAMILLQLYPDIWNVDMEEFRAWYNDSSPEAKDGAWRRVNFAKDTKWNVRLLPDFIESVQTWLNGDNLYDRLQSLVTDDSADKNFDKINSELIGNLRGIGRMTSWLSLQTMYEFFDMNIDKWDFQLADDGCWSQYDALCYLYDRLDLAGAQKLEDGSIQKNKRTKESIKLMEANAKSLMEKLNKQLGYHADVYNVESCLCEYRKTAYGPRKIKEFTGWTANELMYQFDDLVALWESHNTKIDWTPYVLGLMTKDQRLCKPGYDIIYFKVLTETGLNFNTHHFYSDEPNAFEEVDIPSPEDCPQPQGLIDEYNKIPKKIRNDFTKRYAPSKHLRWNVPSF